MIVCLGLVLGGCGAPSENNSSGSSESPAGILSSFSTTTLTGDSVDQTILEGYDLTMVNVWATYCGPCVTEMPYISNLIEDYEEQGVQILGLVSDVMTSQGELDPYQVSLAEDVVEKTGAGNYTHLMADLSLYGLLSQIYAVPTTFFVDSEGNQVGSAYVQMLTEDQFRSVIDETLADFRANDGEV